MAEKKIILNALPPSDIYNPTASLPVLKSFLRHKGFNAEIKYWNLLINPLISISTNEILDEALTKLIPFYSIISDEYNDTDSANKILLYLYAMNPGFIDEPDRYEEYITDIKQKILKIFDDELSRIDFDNVLLFGITSKFYQWLPATILAKTVKEKHPHVKIIIGGFGRRDEAVEILNVCKYFDFACWGEGEYPLLELCNQLKSQNISFDKIPRFTYRDAENIKVSPVTKSDYLDFDNYIYPDYDEYYNDFPFKEKINNIRLPVNSIRSCLWKKCRFCNYNEGYKYRERSPESIVAEIEFMAEKYKTNKFNFVDNDIYGTSFARFDKLLDLITESAKSKTEYDFWTQLIPHTELRAETVKKMADAGFSSVFVGYESVSESLLKKMDKSNTLSNNLFFAKWGIKYNVGSQVNIIRGIPDETTGDVMESARNLHFLRFFLSVEGAKFVHNPGVFGLFKGSRYYKMLTPDEIKEYSLNSYGQYLPDSFLNDKLIFYSGAKKKINYSKEWEHFAYVEHYYMTRKFSYKITETAEALIYDEYCNDENIKTVTFDEPEYIDVLKMTNCKVVSFEELKRPLEKKYANISDEMIKEILANLKAAYLLYYDEELKNIIAIIDIEG